ncbi:MAG: PEP/pyruvate-binding domain-containing protein, partial [Desulfotignum sp.]
MNKAKQDNYVRWFEDLNSEDVGLVGGKNASLGEMVRALKNKNILVPDGFATTTKAYRAFIKKNQLQDKITKLL